MKKSNGNDTACINMKNGVFNLNTMEFLPGGKNPTVEKEMACNYEPEAKCPTFMAMLERVLPDVETRKEFQKACGLVLIDKPIPQKQNIMLIRGPKCTGKTTVLNAISNYALGEYSSGVESSFLAEYLNAYNWGGISQNLLEIRMVSCQVFLEDRLQVTFTKQLDDTPLYRVINGIFFPKHKYTLFIEGNLCFLPCGEKTRHRIKCFPFVVPITTIDRDLDSKLEAEGPGIFNWLLEGMRMVLAEGMTETPQMLQCKQECIRKMGTRTDCRNELDIKWGE